jgi:hypothetical protein
VKAELMKIGNLASRYLAIQDENRVNVADVDSE